jgi:hypothetical protein
VVDETRRVAVDPNKALKAAIMLLAGASGLWSGDRLDVEDYYGEGC